MGYDGYREYLEVLAMGPSEISRALRESSESVESRAGAVIEEGRAEACEFDQGTSNDKPAMPEALVLQNF